MEQIVAACSAGILVADATQPELRIVYANPAYLRLTGYMLGDLVGHPWAVLGRSAAGDEAFAPLKAAIAGGEGCRATIAEVRKDGTSFMTEITVAPLRGPRGDLRYFLLSHEPVAQASRCEIAESAVSVDASGELTLLQGELGRARQKIATIDRIDQATGLVRFPYFQETLRRDLAMARRDRRFVTLLVFEIVEFAAYRQTFGDKAADSCQRMIGAKVMRALRRAGDICARYDDATLVAAVIGQHASEVQPLVEQIAENVRQLKLHNPRAKSSRHLATRATVIGCPPGAHDDPEPLIVRALAESRGGEAVARAVLA